ncbi:homeobox-leucine zipper protein ATHB-14 [Trifolium repens]|nr:homeobox-leucine zipper protein ATHB-14 [Trifolium repens]
MLALPPRVFDRARIEKKHEILEIGCGWGSLAMEVVKRTGCKYTGITLSKEQLKFAEERVKDWPSGLSYFKHGSVSKYSWPESSSAMSRFCVCCFVIETPIYNSHVCTNSSKDQPNTTFQTNLNILFSSLSSNATNGNHFCQTTVASETPNAIKGLFLCRGDTLTTTCHDCVTAASTDLKRRCSVNKEAIIWYDVCTVRYSDNYLNNIVPIVDLSDSNVTLKECADYGVDAYSAACLKSSPYAVPCARPGGFPSSQFLEVVRIEGHAFSLEDVALACDMYLLQVKLSASCAQLVFAPIHELFADDALLVPSSFRVSPLDPKSDGPTSRTLAAMALQYLRSFVGSVQRVSLPWKLLTLDQKLVSYRCTLVPIFSELSPQLAMRY